MAQQYRVDESENRRIRADAEGERQHHDEREAEIATQGTRRIRQILPEFLRIITTSHGALTLLVEGDTIVPDGLDIAELSECLSPRGVRRHSARNETLRAHVEVKGQLIVHRLDDMGATEHETQRPSHR